MLFVTSCPNPNDALLQRDGEAGGRIDNKRNPDLMYKQGKEKTLCKQNAVVQEMVSMNCCMLIGGA
jgi:hypothetical protein